MNLKSLFGMTRVMFAAWFALGVSTLRADAIFDGCTFYSQMRIGGGGGKSGQAVDVGFLPQGLTGVEAKFKFYDVLGTQCLFCSRKDASNQKFTFFASVADVSKPTTPGKPRYDYNNQAQEAGSTVTSNGVYRLRIEPTLNTSGTQLDQYGNSRSELFLDDSLQYTRNISFMNYSSTHRMYLFSTYTNSVDYGGLDSGAKYDFYYLKIYHGPIDSGKLLHHYVPCKTAGGKVAVADLVNKCVYTNLAEVSAFTVEDADRIAGPYVDLNTPYVSDFAATVTSEGKIKVSGKVVNHAGKVTVSLSNVALPPIEVSLGDVASGEIFSREFDVTDGLLNGQYYQVTVTAANGAKATKEASSTPLRFGKSVISHYDCSFTATLSAAAQGLISVTYADFPVLVRIPAAASAKFRTTDGSDLAVVDESGNELSWEMEAFNPAGISYLWVKVPALTKTTKLTIGVGGEPNEGNHAAATWSNYVGVWHFAESEAGRTNIVDSTGHVLDGVSTSAFEVAASPISGMKSVKSATTVKAPDYEPGFDVRSVFTASGWVKFGEAFTADNESVAMKKGSVWNAANGWYLEVPKARTSFKLILGGSAPSTTVSDLLSNWHYYQVVSDGTTVKLYVDGNTAAGISQTYKVIPNTDPYLIQNIHSISDEYRLSKHANTAAESRLEYQTMSNSGFFVYGDLTATDTTVPVLNEPTVVPAGVEDFKITATITNNLPVSMQILYGGKALPMTTEASDVPADYVATLTPSAKDVTDVYAVRAEAASGAVRIRHCTGIFNGDLQIETVRNAHEYGLTNGIIRITRADTAYDLRVNLAVKDSSTAKEGEDYLAFPLSTVIPDGTNSVDVMITPKMNITRTEDATIAIQLAAGPYRIGALKGETELKIIDYPQPSGDFIWCAGKKGKASDPANWTAPGVPGPGDIAIFDGLVSNADCEWDIDASHSVKGWKQLSTYRGTVTMATTYEGDFTEFAVSENMTVSGGRLSPAAHTVERPVDYHRLRIKVGGNLSVGEGGAISATGLGSFSNRTEGASCYGGSYAGASAWGDLLEPTAVGSSADDGTGKALGGGAIWIEVEKAVTNNGRIESNGIEGEGTNSVTFAGSGGSVYLKCDTYSGSGTISARCENRLQSKTARTGAGGRVSVVLLADELSIGTAMKFDAFGGLPSLGDHGGTGTVLVRTPSKPNGVLYVHDSSDKYGANGYHVSSFTNRLTDIPVGRTWKLDGIVFGENGYLCVPEGAVLELVNGLRSVSSRSTTGDCGLVLNGGELRLPEGDQDMSGKWIFNPRVAYTIDGDLTLASGAIVGAIEMRENVDDGDTLPEYGQCFLKVTGDLTVDSSSGIRARGCGLCKAATTLSSVAMTGALPQAHTHGGRVKFLANSYSKYPLYAGYDSVFAPSLPGCSVPFPNNTRADASGGVIKLEIGGVFVMNGTADASGSLDEYAAGSSISGGTGGAIDITAGKLSGSGSFRADGGVRQDLCGPGGRIAIKLTDSDSTFTNFTGSITASGRANENITDKTRWSSSGSVFLRSGEDLVGGGTLRIAMSADNQLSGGTSTTEIVPSGFGGDAPAAFKGLGLDIRGFGYAAAPATADMELAWLRFGDGESKLDLQGRTLEVHRVWIGEDKVAIGRYKAGDAPFGSHLVDSVGGGKLYVSGYGIWVFVQ